MWNRTHNTATQTETTQTETTQAETAQAETTSKRREEKPRWVFACGLMLAGLGLFCLLHMFAATLQLPDDDTWRKQMPGLALRYAGSLVVVAVGFCLMVCGSSGFTFDEEVRTFDNDEPSDFPLLADITPEAAHDDSLDDDSLDDSYDDVVHDVAEDIGQPHVTGRVSHREPLMVDA